MSFLIGYTDPDGNGGYATIEARDVLDSCRVFRFMFGAHWKITQIIDVAVLEAL